MIKTVIRLRNNMVLVFDEAGEEMPQYQGDYYTVKNTIMSAAFEGVVFKHWFGYRPKPRVLPADCF